MGTWDWETWDWQPGNASGCGTESSRRAGRDSVRLFQSNAPLIFLHGVGLGVVGCPGHLKIGCLAPLLLSYLCLTVAEC